MVSLWWTITLLLMVLGLVGTVVPLLPGTTIILATHELALLDSFPFPRMVLNEGQVEFHG